MLREHRIGARRRHRRRPIYFVAARFFPFKTSLLIAWDAGVSIYLAMAWTVIARADAAMTRTRMRTQDQGAFVIFLDAW